MNQVSYLCKQIWDVEWSGILFYSTKGEFGSPEFEVTAEHIFPMNKGTQAYTEFETSGDFVEFLMEKPEFIGLNRGLVHSHNNMGVFFSGTDTSEIKDNSEFYNYYLSLIVNNKGDMCAKIAFRGKNTEEVKKTVNYKGNEGKLQSFVLNTVVEKDVVFVYDCDIFTETKVLVDDEYKKRVETIVEESKKKVDSYKFALDKYKNSQQASFGFDKSNGWGLGKQVDDFGKERKESYRDHNYTMESFERELNWQELKEKEDESSHSKDIEEFVTMIIALDENATGSIADNLKKVRKEFGTKRTEKNEVELEQYLQMILDSYQELYHIHYNDPAEECFMDTLEEVCDIFGEYSTGSWIADEIYIQLINVFEERELEEDSKELVNKIDTLI